MPSKKLRFSRWRRLPLGIHRSGQVKPPNPDDDLERLSLYLPGRLLDLANQLATRAGARDAQEFCEALLTDALRSAQARARLEATDATRGVLEAIDALVEDEAGLSPLPDGPIPLPFLPRALVFEPDPEITVVPDDNAPDSPAARVLAHAGLDGADAFGLLERLRRGQRIALEDVAELITALHDLESQLAGAPSIDRSLAFTLHRIALESQLLITEAWPALAADPDTVSVVQRVQELVDRILSGEDIRYARPDDEP